MLNAGTLSVEGMIQPIRPFILTFQKKLVVYKRSSLFILTVKDKERRLNDLDNLGQCCKTFFACNLQIFVIS